MRSPARSPKSLGSGRWGGSSCPVSSSGWCWAGPSIYAASAVDRDGAGWPFAPLALASVLLPGVTDSAGFLADGLGGGALAVPLFGMAEGYAMSPRGSAAARAACGLLALSPHPDLGARHDDSGLRVHCGECLGRHPLLVAAGGPRSWQLHPTPPGRASRSFRSYCSCRPSDSTWRCDRGRVIAVMGVPPPLVAVAAALAQRAVTGPTPAPGALRVAVTAMLSMASMSLAGAAASQFRRNGTTVEPLHPEKASVLVTSGANAISRNPMYLGMAGLLVAHAVWRGSLAMLVPAAGFVVYIDLLQVRAEESALADRFGAEYEAYRAASPRWLDHRSFKFIKP